MSRSSELLAAFDDAWGHPWESLEYALNGMTEEEANFQHPVYSDVPQEDGHPPSGTIRWHLVHLAQCYRHYTAAIEQRPRKPEEIDPPEPKTLAEAIEIMKRDRDQLRAAISAVPENGLEEPLYYGKPVVALARSTVRHDGWHAGQIALARRLFRMRERM